jgi:CheY-like chemotaxis protein
MTAEQRTGKTILVVEDDADILNALILVLEDAGYTVAGAADGRQALDYLRGNLPPRLILLDLMMPVMDGWQFRREQEQDPALASIPVLVISAGGLTAQKAAALGAAGFLQKPVEVEALLDAIRRHC